MGGFAEPMQETLGSIAVKQELEVLAGLPAAGEQPVADRRARVSRPPGSHKTIASR
jgi:hypothetical protein